MIPPKIRQLSETTLDPYKGRFNVMHNYISVQAIKEWSEKRKVELFEKFDNHIAIGITIVFDELLQFIEK